MVMIRRLLLPQLAAILVLPTPSKSSFITTFRRHHCYFIMPSSNNNNNRRRSARLNAPPSPSASLSSNKKRNIRTTTKAEAKSTNNNNDNNHDDYSSMKVAELRELLKKRGLAVSGVKSQLVERLSLNNDTNNVNNEKEQVQEVDDDDATKKQQRRKRVKATSSSNKSSAAAAAAAKTDSYYLPRTREKQLQSKNNNTLQVIGVDEAGRGPLAGPVVAAAAIVPTNISGIIDSKKITNEVERERLYEELIASSNIKYAVAVISAQRIDEINILQATLEGMRMAVEGVMGIRKVDSDNNVVSAKREEVSYIVTGGIDDNDSTSSSSSNNNNASSSYHALIDGNKVPKDMPCQAEALVKGDGREYSIGAASVLAKVTRDRLMHEYNALYPEYNLSQHKGYPTAAHMSAVSKFGASPIHRRTFAPLKHMEFDKDGKVMGSKKKK